MNIVIGSTGASGVIYTIKLLEALRKIEDVKTHLVLSKWAIENIKIETSFNPQEVMKLADYVYDNENMAAAISSGSFSIDGMIIMPCSMKTLSAIANGYADSLISRAADVTMKEGRKLVLSPRETPLSAIHIENMLKLSRLGVQMVPPIPSFYNKPKSIDDIINQHVMRVLDQFHIETNIGRRWEG